MKDALYHKSLAHYSITFYMDFLTTKLALLSSTFTLYCMTEFMPSDSTNQPHMDFCTFLAKTKVTHIVLYFLHMPFNI